MIILNNVDFLAMATILNIILINGVFSVGGKLSLIVMRKTVIDNNAEIPRVTFSPDSEGT